MNYEQTLDYLFERLPMFQRIGKAAYRKDLRNTLALASMTNNPEEGFKSIHLAGTNGKGSTAHALAAAFQACGYTCGLMTSPHYKDFRERIRIDGAMISEEYIVDWVAKWRKHFEPLEPSFFELTTIMGFCYFKEQGVDIAIIETGMGGRLDSTNIVRPELSIITPISLDHKAFLGDTVEQIALEKAGIIKQGVPVVLAPGNEGLLSVFESVAEDRKSPLRLAQIQEAPIATDVKGKYQQENLSTALEAIRIMRDKGWSLSEEHVRGAALVTAARTTLL